MKQFQSIELKKAQWWQEYSTHMCGHWPEIISVHFNLTFFRFLFPQLLFLSHLQRVAWKNPTTISLFNLILISWSICLWISSWLPWINNSNAYLTISWARSRYTYCYAPSVVKWVTTCCCFHFMKKTADKKMINKKWFENYSFGTFFQTFERIKYYRRIRVLTNLKSFAENW